MRLYVQVEVNSRIKLSVKACGEPTDVHTLESFITGAEFPLEGSRPFFGIRHQVVVK